MRLTPGPAAVQPLDCQAASARSLDRAGREGTAGPLAGRTSGAGPGWRLARPASLRWALYSRVANTASGSGSPRCRRSWRRCAQNSNSRRSRQSSASRSAGSYRPRLPCRTSRWLRATTPIGSSCRLARSVATSMIAFRPDRARRERPARRCRLTISRRASSGSSVRSARAIGGDGGGGMAGGADGLVLAGDAAQDLRSTSVPSTVSRSSSSSASAPGRRGGW